MGRRLPLPRRRRLLPPSPCSRVFATGGGGNGDALIGAAAALASALSWALGSVLFRRLGDVLAPVMLTAAKGVTGAAMLTVALWPLATAPVADGAWSLLIVSGLLGIAAGDTLFFMALNRLGAQAVVLLLTLGQVLTVLLAVLWLGERPGPAGWAGIALVISGVGAVMWLRMRDEGGQTQRVGILCGLGAVLCMAVSIIIAKQALDAGENSVQATLIRMLAGTAGAIALGVITGQKLGQLRPALAPRFAGLFLVSVAVVTFGGFWLSLFAVQHAGVAIASTLGSLEPVLVLPFAAILLRERITAPIAAGTVAATVGAVLLARPW
jgi:drug/metabolite transporter (DMT)-like permease